MYSFNVKADSLLQLGQRLGEASKMFLAEQVHTEDRQTNFDFNQTVFPTEKEEVSQISVGEMRAQTEVKKERKPRTTKPKQVNASLVIGSAETPSVSTSESVSANTYTREVLTAKLNAFLEHKDGGIQPARDLLGSFGASKMSDISDDGIEAVIVAINAVIGN